MVQGCITATKQQFLYLLLGVPLNSVTLAKKFCYYFNNVVHLFSSGWCLEQFVTIEYSLVLFRGF